MRALKRVASFLAALLLVGSAVFLAARSALLDWGSVLKNGWGLDTYEALGASSGGVAAAADLAGECVRLTCFSTQREPLAEWSVQLPQEESGGTLDAVYPIREDIVFLSVYDKNAEHLTLYRAAFGGQPKRILRENCRGVSSAERRESTRLYGFSRDGEEVSFALLAGGEIRAYRCPAEGGGVEELTRMPGGRACAAAVLPDSTLALGGSGWLTLGGTAAAADLTGQTVEQLTRTGSGLYYVDTATLQVWYTDLTGSAARQVLPLAETVWARQLTGLSLTPQGGALVLLDGHTLYYVDESGAADWTQLLCGSETAAAAKLTGTALGVLLTAAILWYLACGARRGRMPLAVYWGGCVAALALVVAVLLQEMVLLPESRETALDFDRTAVGGVVQLAMATSDITDPGLTEQLIQAMEADGQFRNITGTVARRTQGGWLTQADTFAVTEAGFNPSLAAQAMEQGTAARIENGVFQFAIAQRERVLCLSMETDEVENTTLFWGVMAGLVLVTAAAFLALVLVNRDVCRLAWGMEHLSDGTRSRQLRMATGDELEGMASTLNSLAASMESRDRERETLAQSYRRFVPEPVLGLLGKQSILDVDKNTFATRRMAVMMVWFTFPDPVYNSSNSRLLFDSVNQVIERTASIAAQKGGTVFNYAYNGYDVVLEEDLRQVVSTAVAIQQEVLALNELRSREGLPHVTLRIALDVGDVLVGVVGDSSRMEPTTVSSSFSTVRELIDLCGKLDAGILCTEAIIAGAEGYGNRYMGKCWMNQAPIRVYEIFDGDPYGVRKGKENTIRKFSQGVLQLYSGDTVEAKRYFLELAHDNPGDGGVRYYLYLADRLEAQPDQSCSLNGG